METMNMIDPHLTAAASPQAYYDARFAQGYADGWPPERHARLRALIAELQLPSSGTALDFGCGRGDFTGLLAECLPEWEIHGTDVSQVALEVARGAYPQCTFVPLRDLPSQAARYDFIFSHHVLEHVPSVPETLALIRSMVTQRASLLFVLPCGDAGSLEHRLAQLRVDGIDRDREDRFFCDDGPHLRRLTTDRLAAMGAAQEFVLREALFSDHDWGKRHTLTRKPVGVLWDLTDPGKAVDRQAAVALLEYRAAFLALRALCAPTLFRWRLAHEKRQGRRIAVGDRLLQAGALAAAPVSSLVNRWLGARALREWNERRHERGGSEMYLYFRRTAASEGDT